MAGAQGGRGGEGEALQVVGAAPCAAALLTALSAAAGLPQPPATGSALQGEAASPAGAGGPAAATGVRLAAAARRLLAGDASAALAHCRNATSPDLGPAAAALAAGGAGAPPARAAEGGADARAATEQSCAQQWALQLCGLSAVRAAMSRTLAGLLESELRVNGTAGGAGAAGGQGP
jgi:hypothetical protein